MSYQPLARRYRPQKFQSCLGQDPIIQTIVNQIESDRVASAYLLSGSRGTGKTTLARLIAKALNCPNREGAEPCNQCRSCHEIGIGSSLDVLEVDGASHRGIEDIRSLNETVGYSSGGKGKVYIVDEVHMLTKEAFNALLKTLEEPPPKVTFILATTEPHKVLPTVISRCQHFQLSRIPNHVICQKLKGEAEENGVTISEAALALIASVAEGGLRDAESLLDQMISFHGNTIDETDVVDVLGLIPQNLLFSLDDAAIQGDLLAGYKMADDLFAKGKNLGHFVESLIGHYRSHLLCLIGGSDLITGIPQEARDQYVSRQGQFEKAALTHLLDDLMKLSESFKSAPSARFALEMILMRVIRTPTLIPLSALVSKLHALQGNTPRPVATPSKEPVAKASLPQPPKPAPVEPPKAPTPAHFEPPKPTHVEPPTPHQTPPPTSTRSKAKTDTILRFAGVELEGVVKS